MKILILSVLFTISCSAQVSLIKVSNELILNPDTRRNAELKTKSSQQKTIRIFTITLAIDSGSDTVNTLKYGPLVIMDSTTKEIIQISETVPTFVNYSHDRYRRSYGENPTANHPNLHLQQIVFSNPKDIPKVIDIHLSDSGYDNNTSDYVFPAIHTR